MSRFIIKSELTGIQASIRALDRTRELHLMRMTMGLRALAEQIFFRSQVYVPVDTGALKASGTFEPERGMIPFTKHSSMGIWSKTEGVSYVVHYGTFYAVFVHENMTAYHAPPTGAKFLERAVTEVLSDNNNHIPWVQAFETDFQMQVTGSGIGGNRNLP